VTNGSELLSPATNTRTFQMLVGSVCDNETQQTSQSDSLQLLLNLKLSSCFLRMLAVWFKAAHTLRSVGHSAEHLPSIDAVVRCILPMSTWHTSGNFVACTATCMCPVLLQRSHAPVLPLLEKRIKHQIQAAADAIAGPCEGAQTTLWRAGRGSVLNHSCGNNLFSVTNLAMAYVLCLLVGQLKQQDDSMQHHHPCSCF
jgi:hypothetical protein